MEGFEANVHSNLGRSFAGQRLTKFSDVAGRLGLIGALFLEQVLNDT